MKSLSHVRLFATPWTVAHQANSIHGSFQARVQEWVAISFSRGIFLTQGLNLGLPHCRQMLYHLSHQFISSCLNSNHPLDFIYSFNKHSSKPVAAQAAVAALCLSRAFPCILTAHLCFSCQLSPRCLAPSRPPVRHSPDCQEQCVVGCPAP